MISRDMEIVEAIDRGVARRTLADRHGLTVQQVGNIYRRYVQVREATSSLHQRPLDIDLLFQAGILSKRAFIALSRMGIVNLRDLELVRQDALLKQANCGTKTIEAVVCLMREYKIGFADGSPPPADGLSGNGAEAAPPGREVGYVEHGWIRGIGPIAGWRVVLTSTGTYEIRRPAAERSAGPATGHD